jgi:hypothetical protein
MLFCNCFSSLSNLTCYCHHKIICNIDGNSIGRGKKRRNLLKCKFLLFLLISLGEIQNVLENLWLTIDHIHT